MDEHVNTKWNILIVLSLAICFLYYQKQNEVEDNVRMLQNVFDRYEFVNNITSTRYEGLWNIYDNERKFFENSEGKFFMGIEKNSSSLDLLQMNNLLLHGMATDGMYKDRRMYFNISFILSDEFALNSNVLEFHNKNLSMDYIYFDYFDEDKEGICENIAIDLKFTKDEKIFVKDFQTASASLYSKIEGRIYDEECGFRMHIELSNQDDIVIYIINIG